MILPESKPEQSETCAGGGMFEFPASFQLITYLQMGYQQLFSDQDLTDYICNQIASTNPKEEMQCLEEKWTGQEYRPEVVEQIQESVFAQLQRNAPPGIKYVLNRDPIPADEIPPRV